MSNIVPTQNLLNYQYQPSAKASVSLQAPVLVFIHGLFGDMDNLSGIARSFVDNFSVLRLDLRNHGRSFSTDEMNYFLMAQDVIALLEYLHIEHCILIGHSMGGKTAMQVAAQKPQWVEGLVVIDIAPVAYAGNVHEEVFAGLWAVQQLQPLTRQQAKLILSKYIQNEAVQQFLLKSFDAGNSQRFRFNLASLDANYRELMDWQEVFFAKPTLFIKGANSNYIEEQYRPIILRQFPQAKSFLINGAGHWVHAEKPDYVVRAIERFI